MWIVYLALAFVCLMAAGINASVMVYRTLRGNGEGRKTIR